jgi:hypothetical protein
MKQEFKSDLIFTRGKPLAAYTNASDGFSYPVTLDMRDLVLKTENQGGTSMCAAYTATSWVESLQWRRTGKPVDYDPVELYKKAKTLDGMPNEEGTTLDAVMYAMVDLGWLNRISRRDIRFIYDSNQLKRAVHRYGTCLLGFSISDKWYDHRGKLVFNDLGGKNEGGHAVICTGYTEAGVLIQNSWGPGWGKYGFACISWEVFNRQFMVGAYFKNCLNDVEE